MPWKRKCARGGESQEITCSGKLPHPAILQIMGGEQRGAENRTQRSARGALWLSHGAFTHWTTCVWLISGYGGELCSRVVISLCYQSKNIPPRAILGAREGVQRATVLAERWPGAFCSGCTAWAPAMSRSKTLPFLSGWVYLDLSLVYNRLKKRLLSSSGRLPPHKKTLHNKRFPWCRLVDTESLKHLSEYISIYWKHIFTNNIWRSVFMQYFSAGYFYFSLLPPTPGFVLRFELPGHSATMQNAQVLNADDAFLHSLCMCAHEWLCESRFFFARCFRNVM